MTITIDKGIPLPDSKQGKVKSGPNERGPYPWRTMEIGDSFFVDLPVARVSGHASLTGTRLKRFFSCRAWTEGEVEGTRVWRVA